MIGWVGNQKKKAASQKKKCEISGRHDNGTCPSRISCLISPNTPSCHRCTTPSPSSPHEVGASSLFRPCRPVLATHAASNKITLSHSKGLGLGPGGNKANSVLRARAQTVHLRGKLKKKVKLREPRNAALEYTVSPCFLTLAFFLALAALSFLSGRTIPLIAVATHTPRTLFSFSSARSSFWRL